MGQDSPAPGLPEDPPTLAEVRTGAKRSADTSWIAHLGTEGRPA